MPPKKKKPDTYPRFVKASRKYLSRIDNQTPEYKAEKRIGDEHLARLKGGMKQKESVSAIKQQKIINAYRKRIKKK